mmetsp:Transcript_22962/g.65202  ORF Transcript_22962/g.65202 Transcript_22962/m.65202 type:complete len:88 (+) Transcript_22962:789-1052(+)
MLWSGKRTRRLLVTSYRSGCSSSSRYWSWVTSNKPPSYALNAAMSASRVARSKWLLISSATRNCGAWYMANAIATRNFCPPDSDPTF